MDPTSAYLCSWFLWCIDLRKLKFDKQYRVFMWHQIKQKFASHHTHNCHVGSFLHGVVLENSIKCPKALFGSYHNTKLQMSHEDFSTVINSFYKVNQKFKHFLLFSLLSTIQKGNQAVVCGKIMHMFVCTALCTSSICNTQKKMTLHTYEQFKSDQPKWFCTPFCISLNHKLNIRAKHSKERQMDKIQLKCYQIYSNFYFIHINIIQ